mgnify:CR=1 FL=1|jgi:hypothetical protein
MYVALTADLFTRADRPLTPPAYRQVCSGSTGHAEAVQLTYQKGSVGYGELVEFFYRTHDPTTLNSQGPDRGSRALLEPSEKRASDGQNTEVASSPIPRSKKTSQRLSPPRFRRSSESGANPPPLVLANDSLKGRPIVTAILPAAEWYDAEEYHQKYCESRSRCKSPELTTLRHLSPPRFSPHSCCIRSDGSEQQPWRVRVPDSPLLLVVGPE